MKSDYQPINEFYHTPDNLDANLNATNTFLPKTNRSNTCLLVELSKITQHILPTMDK